MNIPSHRAIGQISMDEEKTTLPLALPMAQFSNIPCQECQVNQKKYSILKSVTCFLLLIFPAWKIYSLLGSHGIVSR